MGILLGLLTALAWGSADFTARFASRRIGTLRATLLMQVWGFVGLTLYLALSGDWGHLFDHSGWRPWAWSALGGVVNTLSMIALYRAFEVGKLSIVAPISCSYSVLTVILSVFSGEVLSSYRLLGIALAILGVFLVARGETAPDDAPSENAGGHSSGIVWALIAAPGFGILFWLLGLRIIPMTGALASVWVIRATGTVLVFGILLAKRARPFMAAGRANVQGAAAGALDTAAFALSNLGMQLEQVSVIGVLGSLYGAVTVGLAAAFLREPVAKTQWMGIALIFSGIFLISR